MKNKILPVIVLYNQTIKESETYKTLLMDSFVGEIFVYDNSPISQKTFDGDYDTKFIYVHDENNGGISKAYNTAASYAMRSGYEWLLLLDQDTSFSEDALAKYQVAILDNPSEIIFVPQIYYSENRLFSPVELGFCSITGKFISVGSHLWNNYSVVNSGICVNLKAFESVGGYNENVRLDFADYSFIEKVKKQYSTFYRIEVDAFQNFSNSETDILKLKRRYDLYIESAINVPTSGLKVFCHKVLFLNLLLSGMPAIAIINSDDSVPTMV